MKVITSTLVLTLFLVFLWAPRADVATLEPLGKLSLSAGAENEEGAPAGGRVAATVLGVLPLPTAPNFGVQGIGHFMGGQGSRYGFALGPVFGWDSGKAGFSVNYQHRTLRSSNFIYVRPSISLYSDQANFNLWYSQPVSPAERSRKTIEYGINQLQGTMHYFPASDLASFMRRDNLELTLGLQANSFAGPGRKDLEAGVGPVFGVAFMPTPGFEVNLLRGTIDNHSRYRVFSGISLYFSKGKETLKELRRRYLEPNNDVNGSVASVRRPPPPAST